MSWHSYLNYKEIKINSLFEDYSLKCVWLWAIICCIQSLVTIKNLWKIFQFFKY